MYDTYGEHYLAKNTCGLAFRCPAAAPSRSIGYILTTYLLPFVVECVPTRRCLTLPSALYVSMYMERPRNWHTHNQCPEPLLVHVSVYAALVQYQSSFTWARQCPATNGLLTRHVEQESCTSHTLQAVRRRLSAFRRRHCIHNLPFEAKPPLTAAPTHSSYSASLSVSTPGWSGCTSLSGSTLV